MNDTRNIRKMIPQISNRRSFHMRGNLSRVEEKVKVKVKGWSGISLEAENKPLGTFNHRDGIQFCAWELHLAVITRAEFSESHHAALYRVKSMSFQ
jgi:hypothetical protein